MRLFIIIAAILTISFSANAQKWVPGHITDIDGKKVSGLIRLNPPGRSPVAGQAFIELKQDEKAPVIKLTTGDLQSFIIGRDSFIVAHAPANMNWDNNEYDFVKVVLDEPTRLYLGRAGNGGRSGFSILPELGIGFGAGTGGYGSGFGGGVGAGISIPLGGRNTRVAFYYGQNTANMHPLTPLNFIDVMSDIMGDFPEIVEDIRNNHYNLGNIDRLLARFEKARAQTNSNTNVIGTKG